MNSINAEPVFSYLHTAGWSYIVSAFHPSFQIPVWDFWEVDPCLRLPGEVGAVFSFILKSIPYAYIIYYLDI